MKTIVFYELPIPVFAGDHLSIRTSSSLCRLFAVDQVLDFPPLDLATNLYSKPKPNGSISPEYATMFNLCYAGPETAEEPGVLPVLARIEDLKGMPGALVIVCGKDILHDEGVKYAEMLRAAGTEFELHDYSKEKHGFIYFRPSSNVKEAIRYMTEFIRINATK